MSVRHSNTRMVLVSWCFKPNKPIPGAPTPKPKEVTWSEAVNCHYHSRTIIHQSKHRTVKQPCPAVLFTQGCCSNTSSFLCGSGRALLKKIAKKNHPVQGSTQHTPAEVDPVTNTRQEMGTFRTTSNSHFFTLEETLFRLPP